ncbi:MAG: hypothetical protein KatS3mg021_1043 [Fimbriimonadales bacterium]|nr:MAG: hypothetical protein KatS3mg021_1043 [Fimbriimonadales bacterium]
MLGWAVLLTLAWLRIEGNPLALVYGPGGALPLDGLAWGRLDADGGDCALWWLARFLACCATKCALESRYGLQSRTAPCESLRFPPKGDSCGQSASSGAMVLGGVISGRAGGVLQAQTRPPSLAGAVLLGACLLSGWSLWRTHRWHTLPLPLLQAGLAASAFSLLWLRVETAALLLFHLALPILAGEPPPPSKPFQQEDKP